MSSQTPSSNPWLQGLLPLPIVSIVVFLAGILVRISTDDYIGTTWKNVGTEEPDGTEFEDNPLQVALKSVPDGGIRVFTQSEWNAFGIEKVEQTDFVTVGDYYFKPYVPDRGGLIWKNVGAELSDEYDIIEDDALRSALSRVRVGEVRVFSDEEWSEFQLRVGNVSYGYYYKVGDNYLTPIPWDGTVWENMGTKRAPTSFMGTELLHPLQVALAPYVVVGDSRVFTESEWSALGIGNVQRHHFVKAGDYYFMPEGSVIPRGRTKSSIVKILQAFLTSSLYSRSWPQALWVTLADLLLLTTVEVLEGTLHALFVLSVSFLSSNALPYMREHGKDNLMRIESCCGEYKHATVLGFVLIAVAKSIDTKQKLFANPLAAKAWMLLIPLIGIAMISVSILADDGRLGWNLAAGLMVGMGMALLVEAMRTRPRSTTTKAKPNPFSSRPYESYYSDYYPPIQW